MEVLDTEFEGQAPAPAYSLLALALCFLRIALSSFGGHMAMISATQNLIIERRKLLSADDFMDGLSLASMLPGPIAINVVAYVGFRLRGLPGALVTVCAALTPAFCLMLVFAALYTQWADHKLFKSMFAATPAAVAAIVFVAAWSLSKTAIIDKRSALIALAAGVLTLSWHAFYASLAIIFGALMLGVIFYTNSTPVAATTLSDSESNVSFAPANKLTTTERQALLGGGVTALFAFCASFSEILLAKLFLTFASMSLLLFGGAYVFIPLMQPVVVESHQWLTQQEFNDALAIAQLMPGPVAVITSFIGFKIAGIAGALLSTVGIVLPSASVMLICVQLLDRIRNAPKVQAALKGVRAAVVGMIFAAVVLIAKTATPSLLSVVIAVGALVALLRYKREAAWIVLTAALLGLVSA